MRYSKKTVRFWAMGGVVALSVGPAVVCLSHKRSVPTHIKPMVASVDRVASLPLYQEAQAACRNGQFRRAADLLQTLISSSSLSATELKFCKQQCEVCLRDTGENVIVLASASDRASHPILHPATPEEADCGARALLTACQRLKLSASLPQLRSLSDTTLQGATLAGLAKAAQAVGLHAQGVQVDARGLARVHPLAIAWVNNNHFVTLLGITGEAKTGSVTFLDPDIPGEQTLSQASFLAMSNGFLLLLTPELHTH